MHSRTYLFALCQLAWQIGTATASPYQSRVQETGTVFPAPAEFGTWQMVSYTEDFGDDIFDDFTYTVPALAYIQTIGTSSGDVRVQIAPNGYSYVALDETSAISLQNNGVWELADYDNDGTLDLIYIQNRNTDSGKVEITVASGASKFQSYLLQNVQTVFDVQINGCWQMVDVDGDGTLDLVYIQTSNTESNYAEVFVASGASSYSTLTSKTVSSLSISNDGTWQLANWNMAGSYDLVFIQNMNTASGYVEVNVASAASGYQTIIQSVSTTFSVENNGTWMMYDWDGDSILDLIYIKQDDTPGTVEVHVAVGSS
ncbi:uncharacterized protein N7496_010285 [Penicillium cataractarum]|uniref:FG-GAP repeat protein n=1 Tax=Penicillium cataractarum TaxID=2100454 RepID=A0A9W9V0R5_9EURO|nr:uncharacterized protein N7496_010285 [Penicillium cataractarum]KAJ5364572.1 hypothetical protein N7496_010285 [Penicillium cataractarum]